MYIWKKFENPLGNMNMYNRVSFTFTTFDFIIPRIQHMPKNQNQKYVVRTRRFFLFLMGAQPIRNDAETYNIFFRRFLGWVKIWNII